MPRRLPLACLPALLLALALAAPGPAGAQARREPTPATQTGRATPARPASAAEQAAAAPQDDFPDFTSDPATRYRELKRYRVEQRQNTYPDGTVRTRWHVRIGPDGRTVRDGPLVSYHPNGNLALLGAYRDGRPSGVWHWFDLNGDLMRTAVPQPDYDEVLSGRDLENTATIYRDLQGRKEAEGVRKYGEPVGPWTYYYPDGSLHAQGRFVAGLPDGRWVVYYGSGMVKRVDTYKLGVTDGLVMQGWPDGADRLRGHMSQGLRVGHWRTWYENGQIESEGDYREDQRQGDWRFWDEQGTLLRHVRYAGGRIVAELPIPKPRVGPPPVIPEPQLLPFRPRVYNESGRQIRLNPEAEAIRIPAVPGKAPRASH